MLCEFRDAHRTRMAKTTAILLTTLIGATAAHADDKKKTTTTSPAKIEVTINNTTSAAVTVKFKDAKRSFDPTVIAGASPRVAIDPTTTSISWEAFSKTSVGPCDSGTVTISNATPKIDVKKCFEVVMKDLKAHVKNVGSQSVWVEVTYHVYSPLLTKYVDMVTRTGTIGPKKEGDTDPLKVPYDIPHPAQMTGWKVHHDKHEGVCQTGTSYNIEVSCD